MVLTDCLNVDLSSFSLSFLLSVLHPLLPILSEKIQVVKLFKIFKILSLKGRTGAHGWVLAQDWKLLRGECTCIIPHLSLCIPQHCHALGASLQLMVQYKKTPWDFYSRSEFICVQLGDPCQLVKVGHCGVEESGKHFTPFTII